MYHAGEELSLAPLLNGCVTLGEARGLSELLFQVPEMRGDRTRQVFSTSSPPGMYFLGKPSQEMTFVEGPSAGNRWRQTVGGLARLPRAPCHRPQWGSRALPTV